MLKLKLQYSGHLMWKADSLEKTLMLERLRARGEGGDRGWDDWMTSLIQWTWILANSGRWWRTGKPGVLQFMGWQRVGHDWETELNWTDAEAKAAKLCWPDAKSQIIGKDPDAGKDWGQEEKGVIEDEMVGWHHWLSGHEFEQTLGVSKGQGSLACCSPWGCKKRDMTERLNNNKTWQIQ